LAQLLDRFFDSHHELWTRPAVTHLREREKWKEFYIFSWPTHLGGFFSLLFLVISLTTALFLGLPFQVLAACLIWSGRMRVNHQPHSFPPKSKGTEIRVDNHRHVRNL
jgi:hypothetical protein